MVLIPRLSFPCLTSYIETVELPLRRIGRWGQSADEILRYGGFVGSVVERYKQLHRTMTAARQHIGLLEKSRRSVASGTIITADSLSGSKGRFSRNWHAPPGGLWGTLIVVNTLLPESRQLLPLAVGVACCEAVRRCGLPATIRWINDVLIEGRKVGGFLCESFHGEISQEEYCLLGFGINVNNENFPDELRDLASSLSLNLGAMVKFEDFACSFLASLTWNIGLLYYQEDRLLRQQTTEDENHPLLERWLELSDSVGRRVMYGFDVLSKPQYRAMVRGLDGDGGLRLVLEDGAEIVEHSGEIRYL